LFWFNIFDFFFFWAVFTFSRHFDVD
jgi:hypothetical protein